MPLPSADNIHELLIRNAVDYAIFMLDPHGRVMSWNPGAQQIKGYAPEEIIGEHFSRFYTDEDRAAGMPENALILGLTVYDLWSIRACRST
jgi:PAS domain S-box-containing protein